MEADGTMCLGLGKLLHDQRVWSILGWIRRIACGGSGDAGGLGGRDLRRRGRGGGIVGANRAPSADEDFT